MTEATLDILLVEDSPTQAALILHALEERGHRVRPARNGQQALDLARERAPSLVVSDIMMPGMDGYALCRALKGDEATRGVPVILLTTLNEPADIVRGIECGADNFICKPFSAEVLLERIDFFLQNGVLRRNQMFELLHASLDALRRKHESLERSYHELRKISACGRGHADAVRICARCKKVQDDRGEWIPVEDYFREAEGLAFTHEFCRECGDGLWKGTRSR